MSVQYLRKQKAKCVFDVGPGRNGFSERNFQIDYLLLLWVMTAFDHGLRPRSG